MENILEKLFSEYLSEQTVNKSQRYSQLSKDALQKEKELRSVLTEKQTELFEELFEITSEIHFLEVKDAFTFGCKLGAKASKEFIT